MRRLILSLLAITLAAPAAAHADWGPAVPIGPAGPYSAVAGLAAQGGDRPAALLQTHRDRRSALELRRAGATGRFGAPATIATSANSFGGAGLFAGPGRELIAGWLEIIHGSRRPVVALGRDLADRQVLAPGPRSTQVMRMAADPRGDAVVAFWRYEESRYAVWAAYRPAGGRFGAAQRLGQGDVGDPALAIDGDGTALVAWREPDGVRVARHAPGSGEFAAPQVLAGSAGAAGDPDVAIDGGRSAVGWVARDADGTQRVLVSESPGPAEAYAAPVAVSAVGVGLGRRAGPSVAIARGRALVAWVQSVPGTVARDQVALASSTPSGSWSRTTLHGARTPAHIVAASLLDATDRRPAMLLLTAQQVGSFRTLTATVRSDGTLAPTRSPAAARRTGFGAWGAQGQRHTFLAFEQPAGPGGRLQPLLLTSS